MRTPEQREALLDEVYARAERRVRTRRRVAAAVALTTAAAVAVSVVTLGSGASTAPRVHLLKPVTPDTEAPTSTAAPSTTTTLRETTTTTAVSTTTHPSPTQRVLPAGFFMKFASCGSVTLVAEDATGTTALALATELESTLSQTDAMKLTKPATFDLANVANVHVWLWRGVDPNNLPCTYSDKPWPLRYGSRVEATTYSGSITVNPPSNPDHGSTTGTATVSATFTDGTRVESVFIDSSCCFYTM